MPIGIGTAISPTFTGYQQNNPASISGLTTWLDANYPGTVNTGGALQLTTGDKHYLTFTTAPDPATSDFSLDFCINSSSFTAQNIIISTGATANGMDGFTLSLAATTGKMFVYINDSVEANYTSGLLQDSNASTGTWYHYLVCFDRSGNATCYINGVLQTTTIDISAHQDTLGATATSSIGTRTNGGLYLSASLAAFRFWPTLLDQTDATYLYNSGQPRYYGDLSATYVTKLGTGYNWNMNEGAVNTTTATVYDQHGSNDLTFSNTELVTNGAMASDTGWTGTAGTPGATDYDTTATIAAGVMTMACSGDSGPTTCSVGQALALVSGNTYTFAGSFTRTSGLINLCVRATIDPASAGETVEAFSATNATYSENYTMTSTRAFLLLQTTNNAAASWVMDNISVKSYSLNAVTGPACAIASDSIGTNHGTLTGFTAAQCQTSFTTDVPTAIGSGYSLSCDGTANYVLCSVMPSLLQANAYSVSGWFKSSSTGDYVALIDNIVSTAERCAIQLKSGYLVSGHWTGSTYNAKSSDAVVNDGAWHHFVFAHTAAGTNALYVDNVLQTGTTTPSTGTTVGLTFGGRTTAAGFLAAKIDDFRIYNATLSASQVTELYAGNEATGATPIGKWTFDDGPFSTPADGDPIYSWTSRDANKRQFFQTTSSKRPLYKATAGPNGLPSILFDGTDDLLVASTAYLTGQVGTVFAVYNLTATPNSFQAFLSSCDDATSTKNVQLYARGNTVYDGAGYTQNDGGTYDGLDGNTAIAASTTYITVIKSDGSTITARVNGTAQTLSAYSGANSGDWWDDTSARDNVTVGASKYSAEGGFLSGYISEVIVYSRALNSGEIGIVEKYLGTKYNVSI